MLSSLSRLDQIIFFSPPIAAVCMHIFSLYAMHCTWFTASEEELLNDPPGWTLSFTRTLASVNSSQKNSNINEKFTSLELHGQREKRNCFDLEFSTVCESERSLSTHSQRAASHILICLYGDRITCFSIYHSLIVWCQAGTDLFGCVNANVWVLTVALLLSSCNDKKRARLRSRQRIKCNTRESRLTLLICSWFALIRQFASISVS